MLKIKSMRKIFFIISLVFSILIISNSELTAQNSAPTYQSLITMGDKEFNNAEYIKAGAPARSERLAKYNRLLEIENMLG